MVDKCLRFTQSIIQNSHKQNSNFELQNRVKIWKNYIEDCYSWFGLFMKGNKNITSIVFSILSTTSISIILQNTCREEFNPEKLGLKFEYDESIENSLEKMFNQGST